MRVFVGVLVCFVSQFVSASSVDVDSCPLLDPRAADRDNDIAHASSVLSSTQQCFLDCTRSESADIACEDVTILDVLNNAKIIPEMDKLLHFYIWNSPMINELEGSIFGPISSKLRTLSLMNLDGLRNFPMLRELPALTRLEIKNAPSLAYFSTDLLPSGLERLTIYQTSIGILSSDLQNPRPLNKMKRFVFEGQTIQSITNSFLNIFPKLTYLEIRSNNMKLTRLPKAIFDTIGYLDTFIFTDNDFSALPLEMQTEFWERMLESIRLAENATLDLSNNNVLFSKDSVKRFDNLVNVSVLSLAGNPFGQFFAAAGMFERFTKLTKLDLGYSRIPRQKGLLSGLESLQVLILAGNNFKDLTRIDIFDGFKANLSALDLSSNRLMAVPLGSFVNIAQSIQQLDLSNNTFHTELMSPDKLPSPFMPQHNFPNLRILDLSYNQLQIFNGTWLSNFSSLAKLDLSCNRFKKVTKGFFAGLPPTLSVLNLTFCINSMQDAPKIDEDAFSSLGAGYNETDVRFRTLILQSGYFRGWILNRLKAAPNATLASLRELDISHNQIRYVDDNHVRHLTQITSLDLSHNFIQNVGKRTFSRMTNLASLNLAYNFIVCVGVDEFEGLTNLIHLDISHNRILVVDTGAFDSLQKLQELYLGWNLLNKLPKMFVNGGSSLIHLGLQKQENGLTLRTYPEGCLDRFAMDPLSNLQYFYIDEATAIFIDHGNSLAPVEDKMKAVKMKPNDDGSMQCIFGSSFDESSDAIQVSPDITEPGGLEEWTNDFVRLVVHNPYDLSPRTFISLTPKCVSDGMKYLGNSTTDSFCPFRDSKTFVPGDQ